MNKKIQQYGIAIFATMTVAGTAVFIPDKAALQKDGTFSVKVIYHNEPVENASLSLVNLNSETRENLRTDVYGFGRKYSHQNGIEDNKYHVRPPGSYAVVVNKEGIPRKEVRFFLEEDGFTEKVIIIKDPKKNRKKSDTTITAAYWKEKAPMLISKINGTSNAYKQKIYLFGGWRKNYLNSMEIYNPSKDRWETGTPAQYTRDHHSSSVVGEKIYIIAGHSQGNEFGLNVTEIYDPEKDTWSFGAPIPTKRFGHSSSVIKREIYVLGGRGAANNVEIYDTQTNTWRKGTKMPTKRYFHSSHVINKRIFLVGGKHGKKVLNTVEQYDPLRDKWTQKAPMPTPRYAHSGCILNGKIYIFGGKKAPASVEIYDPKSNSWTQEPPMPTERYNTTCSTLGEKVYLLAGSGGWSKNEMYSPRVSSYYP